MKFYLTGVTAVVTHWLGNDCREPIEEISAVILRCILGGHDLPQ